MKSYFGALVVLCSLFMPDLVCGADLFGSVIVNQTSDTAAKAKIDAMNFARRQILSDVLSKYADSESLRNLLENTPDDALVDFIASSSVSNEQISSDSYTANIRMQIDSDAVKDWLISNEVQNWVPSGESIEKFSAFIVVPNGISDWAELKGIARNDNVEIETVAIVGNQILAKMPANYRTKFTLGLRNMGWRYADNSGVLQVWK